ncbi:MAG: ATP-binding cassette domain-containing protein [Polyangiaceae bacterium]|nr:ATP-binding cassette domain-containing protein [Polyangiaceae bacterium]
MLALDHVDKHFGATHAVRDVSIAFAPGAIHAVVGENGAGKSTLLRIAAGRLAPDAGAVRSAPGVRVAMVEQHFALIGALTALDNFILGREPCNVFGQIDRRAARDHAERVARDAGTSVDWGKTVDRMSVGERQRLEILRALGRDAAVLLLDEPTSLLAAPETAPLYALLRRLAASGRAVVVVTHRLGEVREHADRVSILRQGQLVATRAIDRRDESVLRAIADDVMGPNAPPPAQRREGASVSPMPAPPLIELEGVTIGHDLRGISLVVRAGEIVGVAGVAGNGQSALVRVIAGLERPDAGIRRIGRVAALLADRDREGLIGDATVGENLTLGELADFTRWGVVSAAALAREAEARLRRASIAPPDIDAPVRSLSGGNRQKVALARALARQDRADAFVLAEPTQGVDAAGARRMREAIVRAARAGKAVLLVSTDLDELRETCDRIAVIARGNIVAELPPDASDARFGDAMLGGDAPAEGARPA